MSQPLVSIVIPTHNRRKMVLRLLESIIADRYKAIEIIVVDDASIDDTAAAVSRTYPHNPSVRVIRNKINRFTAGSRNVGIKNATGKYIFFIDDDNVVEKNAVSELVNVFENNKMIGELGLVNYSFGDKEKILWVCTKRNMATTKTYQPRTLDEFSGQNVWDTADVPNAFMIRADVIKKNNIFFREKFGIMYEESDFAYRIRDAGYRIRVVRGARIYHDVESSARDSKRKDYMYHFMNDLRRPFVFARNRIIFHSLYSNTLQMFSILLVWIWLFTAYYTYKIICYSGVGNFSLARRVRLVLQYLQGDADGLLFVVRKEQLS